MRKLPEIQEAVEDEPDPKRLKNVAIVKHLLRKAPSDRRLPSRRDGPRNRNHPLSRALIGNPDLAVLKLENQNPTHVTPLIASIAQGFVQEDLVVVGPPPPLLNKALIEAQKKKAYARLCAFIKQAQKPNKYVDYRREYRVKQASSTYLKAVEIDREIYRVCAIPRWFVSSSYLTETVSIDG